MKEIMHINFPNLKMSFQIILVPGFQNTVLRHITTKIQETGMSQGSRIRMTLKLSKVILGDRRK